MRRRWSPGAFIRVLIAIPVAAVLVVMLLFAFFPDLLVLLAWQHSDKLPWPFSTVPEAALVVAAVSCIVVLALLAWYQLRSFSPRGPK